MAWMVVTVSIVGFLLLLEKFLDIFHDAKEPPLIPQSIPYVGHLLGILRDGSRYYTKMRSVPVDDGLKIPQISDSGTAPGSLCQYTLYVYHESRFMLSTRLILRMLWTAIQRLCLLPLTSSNSPSEFFSLAQKV